jgi:Kip1 ubiquitination-promoting complex protein 2
MGIKVQILSSEGHILITQIEPSATVESVKQIALSHFYPTEASSSVTKGEHFRIIHPAQSRTLNDSHIVQEEKVSDNDILLFVKRRENKHLDLVGDGELKAPTLAEINAATSSLPPPSKGPAAVRTTSGSHHEPAESTVDFQLELRKIIISLVSLMSTLLHGNTEANLICKEMHTRLKHRLAAAAKPHEGITVQRPPPPEIPCTPMGIIHGLAEAKKREFRPNQKAFESLREMGFTDEDICNALRACKNNKDHACEWLLSGGGVVIDDVDTGLDQNSHLFNALVTNPTIRLGLNCPKTLLAFLGILESPASANMWLQDSDTAPVLSAIFKIYHSEKHAAPDL